MPPFIKRLLESEAAVTISLVAAALSLAVSFGVDLSDKQTDAILSATTNLFAFLVAGYGIRRQVYSQKSVAVIVAEAVAAEGS